MASAETLSFVGGLRGDRNTSRQPTLAYTHILFSPAFLEPMTVFSPVAEAEGYFCDGPLFFLFFLTHLYFPVP